jgi:hypothetical protein
MLKPFYTAIVAASVVFSTTLLVVAQQSTSLNNPVASPTGRPPGLAGEAVDV